MVKNHIYPLDITLEQTPPYILPPPENLRTYSKYGGTSTKRINQNLEVRYI